MSESLKSNTTLTGLNLWSEDKRKKTYKRHPSTIHSFPFLFSSTDSSIEYAGVTSLSEALKSNTTLTKLNLMGEDKEDTQKTSINNSLFFFSFLINS